MAATDIKITKLNLGREGEPHVIQIQYTEETYHYLFILQWLIPQLTNNNLKVQFPKTSPIRIRDEGQEVFSIPVELPSVVEIFREVRICYEKNPEVDEEAKLMSEEQFFHLMLQKAKEAWKSRQAMEDIPEFNEEEREPIDRHEFDLAEPDDIDAILAEQQRVKEFNAFIERSRRILEGLKRPRYSGRRNYEAMVARSESAVVIDLTDD